jgi:hypothetical protein
MHDDAALVREFELKFLLKDDGSRQTDIPLYPETFQKRLAALISARPKSAMISFAAKVCTAAAHTIATSTPAENFLNPVFMVKPYPFDTTIP